jgi:hypothetical protein
VLEQRLDEPDASVDDYVAVHLLFELCDLLSEVAVEHGRVVPARVIERRGDDVLRHRVELVGELAVARRPRGGEAFVGDASQQERVRRECLVQLELVALVAAADLEAPASVLEVLGSAWILDDTVQRNELGYDDPSHLGLLFVDA